MSSEGGWWRRLHKDVSVLNATELNAKAPATQPVRRSRREPRTQHGGPGTARAQARKSGLATSFAPTKRSQAWPQA